MGVSSSKVVQREHAKRDDTSDSTPSCPSGTSWYNENCADPDQESHGCFDVDPCAGHTISSSSTHAATSASGESRSSHQPSHVCLTDQGGCNPPESFYDTSCDLPGWYFYGCFSPNPCVSASSAAAAESTTGEQCLLLRSYYAIHVLFCKELSLKNAKRASSPTCSSGYFFYGISCGDTGYFEGCFNEEPCDHLGSGDGSQLYGL